MTPKQKAIEIVEKYEKYLYDKFAMDEEWSKCVECALIAVDEIILVTESLESRIFWKQVRVQIDAL
jgi:hypothetical protein